MMAAEDTSWAAAALPEDDGAIDRALAELDARLTRWLAAAGAAQRALLEGRGDAGRGAQAARAADDSTAADTDLALPEPAAAETPPAAEPPAALCERPTTGPATPASAPAAEPAENADDDQALLASLDEKTRAAVLIKRRLFGDQKSVRELLDQIERTGAAQAGPKPEPKRWWRRRS